MKDLLLSRTEIIAHTLNQTTKFGAAKDTT